MSDRSYCRATSDLKTTKLRRVRTTDLANTDLSQLISAPRLAETKNNIVNSEIVEATDSCRAVDEGGYLKRPDSTLRE